MEKKITIGIPEVKRLYMPELSLEWTCPLCSETDGAEFDSIYFSYGGDYWVEECGVCEETLDPPMVISIAKLEATIEVENAFEDAIFTGEE